MAIIRSCNCSSRCSFSGAPQAGPWRYSRWVQRPSVGGLKMYSVIRRRAQAQFGRAVGVLITASSGAGGEFDRADVLRNAPRARTCKAGDVYGDSRHGQCVAFRNVTIRPVLFVSLSVRIDIHNRVVSLATGTPDKMDRVPCCRRPPSHVVTPTSGHRVSRWNGRIRTGDVAPGPATSFSLCATHGLAGGRLQAANQLAAYRAEGTPWTSLRCPRE